MIENEYVESLTAAMQSDSQEFGRQCNIEMVYIAELATAWVEKNVASKEELNVKILAMGDILSCPDYKAAKEAGSIAYRENNREKAVEASECIKRIKSTEEYAINSQKSGYVLLEKFESPETFLTDAFSVHSNIMIGMYKYVKKFIEE